MPGPPFISWSMDFAPLAIVPGNSHVRSCIFLIKVFTQVISVDTYIYIYIVVWATEATLD